jgi:hypothetical protein
MDGVVSKLSHGGNGGDGGSRHAVDVDLIGDFTGGVLLGAIPRDVASLTALVAGLPSSVERTAVGGSAVTGDVAQLAASVALHGLGLAIPSEVVRAATLVTGSWARTTSEATTAAAVRTRVSAAGNGGAATHWANGVGTSTGQVARLTTVVAATASASAAQAEGRAVGLDVAETLAVVALLGLSGTRKRATIGLVAGLLAVVAESLGGGANFSVVANIATLVAGTAREGRHDDGVMKFF